MFNRPYDGHYVAIMHVSDMSIIAAMGIKRDGYKQILGLIAGATENNIVVKQSLADLIVRGLLLGIPRLYVLDGAKASRKGVMPSAKRASSSVARCI